MTSKQEQFIQDLVQFYKNRGINHANSSQFIARINGKVINLCELYTYVLEYGGSYKVNQFNSWDEIYCKLSKAKCIGANFAVALRQIYNRYLLQYEKLSSGNFTGESWNEDEDEENLYYNHHSNSSSSKHHLDSVTESSGQVHNDTKLYCSLLSGLPNELNFAFNVSTILSNCNRFDWTNDYKFVNVLFESMKSYCCVCDQFEEDISFGRSSAQDCDEILMLRTFINSSIINANNPKSNGKLACNDNNERLESNNLNNNDICPTNGLKKDEIEFIERNCNCYRQFWSQICSDEEALYLVFEEDNYEDIDFNLPYVFKDFPVHLLNKIEQRIELIAGILRNISFTYNQNNPNNISMIPLLKFLVLLMRCGNIRYLNLTLDILSNIAPSLSFSSLKPYPETYYSLLNVILKSVAEIGLTSNNIHDTTKSFEIMARFISNSNNESNLLLEAHFKHSELYQRITQLLTCQYDISLILALLEFCLTLSENRPYLLVQNESKTFIKILVNLLNCEANQHFTAGALKKVKVIDERPRSEIAQPEVKNQHPAPNNNAVLRTSTMPSNVAAINQAASNLQNNILDNEAYAINWLRSSYDETQHGCSLKVHDIYAEYVKFCCRNSRKNVIAAQSFNFLIKRCFPVCNINVNQGTVDGLAIKGHTAANSVELQTKQTINTTVITQNSIQPPQLMSPILKAHLSTPPKNNSIPGPNSPVQNSNDLSQPSQSATTNTSTLIKSLLANKLRNNQQSSSSPNSPNSCKPSTNSNQAVQNEIIQQDSNSQKSVIFSTNSTTFALTSNPTNTFASNASSTFAISPNPTTTFAIASNPGLNIGNNFIVQNNAIQQQQQQQQFLLVRTIINAPGQQNPNSPVRLLLPASMIQQRFPAPATVNGMITNSLPSSPIVSAQAPQIQTQLTLPQSNHLINPVNTVPSSVATQPTPVPNRSSITNSPLLNVLLDKGKLPDFGTNNSNGSPPNSISNANNTPVSNIQSPSQQNAQPKMYILTTKPTTNTVLNSINAQPNETQNNLISAGDVIPPNSGLVNGDLKALVSNTNSPVKNNSKKHPLEVTNNKAKPSKRSKKNKPNNLIDEHKPLENNISNSTVIDSNHISENKPNNLSSLANNVSALTNNINNNIHSTDQMKPVAIQVTNESPTVVNNANPVTVTSTPKPELPLEFECQWNNCLMKFARPSDVFYHVHSQHIITPTCPDIMSCLWGGPEGRGPGCLSKRPKLSLLTHLQDFHCNTNVLKQELLRKKQLSVLGTSNITLPQPPAHPGYSQNAAMLAIRRYSTNYLDQLPSTPITPLTPLTVSIRLTSALILRNLAQRSHSVKKSLEMFEPQLCEISIAEGRDESRTIAQCLAVINDRK